MSLPTNLCLFDLDETLLPIDSDHAWGEFIVRAGWVDAVAFARGNDGFYAQYREGRLDIHEYIAFATGPLRSRPAEELAAAHRQFMAEVIAPALRPAALALVREHCVRGDRIALVTATNDFVTAPIAAALGIADLLAVRLERDAGGSITGRIDGTPSYREGKVVRVQEWLVAEAGVSTPATGAFLPSSLSMNFLIIAVGFVDGQSKSCKTRQPRVSATSRSAGEGLVATGSVASSSRGKSFTESL